MNGAHFKTVAIIFLTAVLGLPCEQASAAVAGQIKSSTSNTYYRAQTRRPGARFAEVEIALSEQLNLADVSALSRAPGSDVIILEDGKHVKVQLPADEAKDLSDTGAEVKVLRNFILVEGSKDEAHGLDSDVGILATCSGIYEYGDTGVINVGIPSNGNWIGSGMDFAGASGGETVTCIDIHYEIESSAGFVYAEMSDEYESFYYPLVDGVTGSIDETETGISAFNGYAVDKIWWLWAREEYSSGDGYIYSWWIKLYYGAGPPSYCAASSASNSYEYISSVVVGDISNTGTGSDNYVDYTSLSTTMELETGYAITVTNGNPDSKDECGIWVDWNQNLDFDDVGETIPVSESPGEGPYTATITPPADANLGDTRMRIRITYNDTPAPCGTSLYGEVEDYTITVTAAQQSLTVSGYVKTDGNTAIEGVLITGTNGAGTDTTEANGFYELTLPTNPWTGTITPSKAIWSFVPASTGYSGLDYDVTDANFTGHYNYGGGSGTSGSPYLIATPEDMNAVGAHPEDWDKHFKLIADIDLSSYTGTEFNIIGTFIPPALFTGTFDGNDHKILNFSYTTTGQNCIGLFGAVGGPDTEVEIRNLTLVDPNVDVGSGGDAGALVGFWYKVGTLSDCAVIGGSVKGNGGVAGLLGSNFYGNIIRCSSSADVTATSTGFGPAGGLIGINNFGQVSQCYTSGTVTSNNVAGGLIGSAGGSTINCYSKATVTGPDYAGGLVGYNSSAITNCYSVGGVSGAGDYVGGLVGGNMGPVTASFWDVNTSGQPGPWVGTDLTTVQMQTESTFTDAGWDFVGETTNGPNDVWEICDGTNYPKLAWQAVLPGDLVCPDGVDMQDYAVAAEQWQRQVLVSDIAPDGGDGIVNLLDWAPLANGWPGTTDIDDVAVFADQWLQPSAYCADIAPLPDGDGVVDWFDVAVVAENWLEGVGP